MKWIRGFDALLAKLEGASLIFILFVMMCVAFLQVVLRNVFHTALPWGDGLTRAAVLWAGFIGASLAVREDRYLGIDVVTRWLDARWQQRTRLIVNIYTSGVSFWLGSAGIGFVRSEAEAGAMTSLGVPNSAVAAVIPFTFFFISFRFLLKAMARFKGLAPEGTTWE